MNVTILLPRLYKLQQEIVNDPARFKVICAGRRVGKTVLVQHVAINSMLKKLRICYITPTFILADESFDKMVNVLPPILITKQNKTNRHIELVTGGSIRFFSGEALSRTRGFEYDLIIVDEAAQIPDLASEWNSALRPLLMKTRGTAYFISTPLGKNFFFSLFTKGTNNENGYKSWQFSSYENPHLPKDELDELVKEMPDAIYKQEIMAEPMQNAANPVGTDNINANIITTLSSAQTVVYGIDLAKYSDWTVIIGLDAEGITTYFDRFQLPWQLTQDKIKALPSEILKVVDSTGVGDVVLEALQLTCSNMQGFKFTTESKPKIIYELIKDIEQGKVKYNQITADELHVYQYKFSSTGHIKFEAQAGYNDDTIAALAIANHFKNEAIASSNWKLYFA